VDHALNGQSNSFPEGMQLGAREERLTIWQLYPICAASEKSGSESERAEGKIKMGKFLGGSDAEKAYCR
jgi:hypothetical protein